MSVVPASFQGITLDRFPWERQPGESEKAYQAFVAYREQEPPRRIADVSDTLHKSIALINRWSQKHLWLQRVSHFDVNRERSRAAETKEQRREMNERHAKLAKAMSGKVAQRIQALRPEELSPGELGRWMQVISMVERLALGEATERTESTSLVGQMVDVEVHAAGGEEFDRDRIGEILDRLAARGVVVGPGDDGRPEGTDDPSPNGVHPNGSDPGAKRLPAGPAT